MGGHGARGRGSVSAPASWSVPVDKGTLTRRQQPDTRHHGLCQRLRSGLASWTRREWVPGAPLLAGCPESPHLSEPQFPGLRVGDENCHPCGPRADDPWKALCTAPGAEQSLRVWSGAFVSDNRRWPVPTHPPPPPACTAPVPPPLLYPLPSLISFIASGGMGRCSFQVEKLRLRIQQELPVCTWWPFHSVRSGIP